MYIVVAIIIIMIVHKMLFGFKTKGGRKLYDEVIAHRGLHIFDPENSLAAYIAAKDARMNIELDVRQTKDKEIVCFHDRYTKRLLNIPGKLSMFDLATIKRYRILDSEQRVPTLKEALSAIYGCVTVLIEVKGTPDKQYLSNLLNIVEQVKGDYYFHTKNIITYFCLKKMLANTYGKEKRVFLILNIFRKRFNFVKGADYSFYATKYNDLDSSVDVQLPSIDDITSIIVRSIETIEDKKEILATIGEVINKYESRVSFEDKSHWVFNSLWLHRGIVSDKYLEHSLESFRECVNYAESNGISITIEFDVMLHKSEVRCYHKDRISSLLGQSKSCAEKLELENSIKLIDILELVKGCKNVNLAIDIKDYHISDRTLEDLIIHDIKKSKYAGNFIVMSYNPMVLWYFKTVEPEWLRAQIGHSLKGLRKVPFFRFPWILNAVLGILFDMSCADCVVFDNSKWIYYLIAYHKNIRGKPVLIYAPKTYMEQEAFIGRESVANFIIENVADEESWPKEYIMNFKKEKEEK